MWRCNKRRQRPENGKEAASDPSDTDIFRGAGPSSHTVLTTVKVKSRKRDLVLKTTIVASNQKLKSAAGIDKSNQAFWAADTDAFSL